MDEKKPKILATPENIVPKYCNSIFFSKNTDGQMIISFHFNNMSGNEENQLTTGVVIETIFIDKEHAQQIVDKLSELLKEEKK